MSDCGSGSVSLPGPVAVCQPNHHCGLRLTFTPSWGGQVDNSGLWQEASKGLSRGNLRRPHDGEGKIWKEKCFSHYNRQEHRTLHPSTLASIDSQAGMKAGTRPVWEPKSMEHSEEGRGRKKRSSSAQVWTAQIVEKFDFYVKCSKQQGLYLREGEDMTRFIIFF